MSNPGLGRNYHTFHKTTTDDTIAADRIVDNLVSWGIYREVENPNQDKAEINKDDIKYCITDGFYDFKQEFLKKVIGGREGLDKEIDAFTKDWKKEDSQYGDVHADFNVMIFADIILHFEAFKEYFNDEEERLGPPKKGEERPGPTWGKITSLSDKIREQMVKNDPDQFNEVFEMAKTLHGYMTMKIETELEEKLRDKMISLDIITDTGHLTNTFRDCVQMGAKDTHKSYEQMALEENNDILKTIILEYIREEDYEIGKTEEYMDKLGDDKLMEISNMADIVRRYILFEATVSKEELE